MYFMYNSIREWEVFLFLLSNPQIKIGDVYPPKGKMKAEKVMFAIWFMFVYTLYIFLF